METRVVKIGGAALAEELAAPQYLKTLQSPTVVVVSAIGRPPYPFSTDGLKAGFSSLNPQETDRLLALGETYAVLKTVERLRSLGFDSSSLGLEEALFITDSSYGRAEVVRLQAGPLLAAMKKSILTVAPGFIARDSFSHPTTMGRESSDYSGVMYAAALGLSFVTLVKDLTHVYRPSGGTLGDEPLEYCGYGEALRYAEQGLFPVAPKALARAESLGLKIVIENRQSQTICTVFRG